MENKVPNTELPPSYSASASTPYPTTTPHPDHAAPGPITYEFTQSLAEHPPQPVYGYDTPLPPQSPQQQQMVVVGAGQQQLQPIIVHHVPSYVGHIVFACIVFFICNWLFGLIAVLLAG